MSDRSILDKYGGQGSAAADGKAAPTDLEAIDDLGSYGWLRGIRDRAQMLELRKKNGNILAVGYGWLERAEFDPSIGITLTVLGQPVRITGRNLNAERRPMIRLFSGIARHRVPWVQEADEPTAMKADKEDTVIESIEW